jgi:hypothetical protein
VFAINWRGDAIKVAIGVVVGVVLAAILALFWVENERRYAALSMTGCYGSSSLPPTMQDCNGAKRLCRDAPPLIDWRQACQ